MEKEKNNSMMWVVGIVAIILIVVVVMAAKNKNDNGTPGQNYGNESATTEPESVQDVSDATSGAGIVTTPLTYTQALEKYADRRIQFGKNCQAYPNKVTYKDNTGIMLDNRTADTLTIKVGTNYTVKGYGFKIVVLPDTYLKSSTVLVDCGAQQNVATILIQE